MADRVSQGYSLVSEAQDKVVYSTEYQYNSDCGNRHRLSQQNGIKIVATDNTAKLLYPPRYCYDFDITMQISLLLVLYAFVSCFSSTAASNQQPIMDTNLGPAFPHESGPQASSGDSSTVILSDVLGRDRSINVFAGFVRDITSIDSRLNNEKANTTILAPVNSAIMTLPRKPWEDAKDYDTMGPKAYVGDDGEARAHKNLRRFVEAHIVPVSPWQQGDKIKTILGDEVWWETKDGVKTIQPGNIVVSSTACKVANGEVWILKGARNYQ